MIAFRTFCVAVLLVTCSACSSTSEDMVTRLSASDASECREDGGEVRVEFLAENCVRIAKDAGTSCTDSKQCEGRCLAPADTPRGAEVEGSCSATSGDAGCANIVTAGLASGDTCAR